MGGLAGHERVPPSDASISTSQTVGSTLTRTEKGNLDRLGTQHSPQHLYMPGTGEEQPESEAEKSRRPTHISSRNKNSFLLGNLLALLIKRKRSIMDTLLSPVNAAKTMGLLLLVHGIFHSLAPSPTAKKYGVPSEETGEYKRRIRRIGCSFLFTCVLVWFLIFQEDKDRSNAYAMATMIWFLEFLQAVLNQEGSALGDSDTPDSVMILFEGLLIVGFLNEEWAPIAAHVSCGALLGFACSFILAPKFLRLKMWKGNPKLFDDEEHLPYMMLVMRANGIAILQSGIFMAFLEYGGMDAVLAFGNSCIVLVVGLLWNVNLSNFGLSIRHLAMAAIGSVLTLVMVVGGKSEVVADQSQQ